jgi:hypothetical protein
MLSRAGIFEPLGVVAKDGRVGREKVVIKCLQRRERKEVFLSYTYNVSY